MLCHPQSQELEAVAKQPDYPWAVSKIHGCTSMPLKYGDLPIYPKKHVALEVGKFLPEMATYLWALLKFHMFHVFFFWLCITMLFLEPNSLTAGDCEAKTTCSWGWASGQVGVEWMWTDEMWQLKKENNVFQTSLNMPWIRVVPKTCFFFLVFLGFNLWWLTTLSSISTRKGLCIDSKRPTLL